MKPYALLLPMVLAITGAAQKPSPASLPSLQGQSLQSIIRNDPGVQKATALLDDMIQALGGPAYMNLQDMEQSGRTYGFYHGSPSGIGARFWRFWKWPDKDRFELTKQRDVIYIYNGDQGWETTYKGTRLEEPEGLKEYLRSRHYSLANVLRKWLQEPGTALFYDGSGLAQQKQVEKVTIMNANNEAVTLFIDQRTHLPVKKSYEIRDPVSREFDEEAEVYDNWRVIQGVTTAYSVTEYHNGEMSRQRFIQNVVYDQGLPDSKFTATVTYTPKTRSR